ncbi:NYN domain-containing protein [Marinobacter sp. DSM 26671]|jgi:uncharacterized LabA/DUF88 family protein|uniref:NYN domain-containing protein n=1 Tax=Marinobacter nauticus (strain ATCC 700491 / DSM 11845 / VT8) TaxID=351348 RepID=A1TWL8_MARN8|nr:MULTISPECIES: NYN domain-containing protein [unclassified Marinobacter]ABM17137.1 conserved hypothetical protein [Marinobacter nauticus VT8]ERS85271.1 Gp9, Cpp15 [Marinobacter sp. C1S70]SFE57442.1 NYN domain-containing protein [Marinobacter sp. DSM 26671]
MSHRNIAILIDGGFFLKRLPKLVNADDCDTVTKVTDCIRRMCKQHIRFLTGDSSRQWHQHVYRIFFYDALPYDGKAHHPIDNRAIDFAKSDVAKYRHELFDALRKQRKVALRLGKVNKDRDWTINPRYTKKLLKTREWLSALDQIPSPEGDALPDETSLTLTPEQTQSLLNLRDLWSSLDGGTVSLGLHQKGVDMRIGIDIASLTLKQQVDTIILVAGDSDFVPAAKMARREGIEFILDPLWQEVNADLFEHIDGLQSGLPKPGTRTPPQE